jgi:hypothetical protein
MFSSSNNFLGGGATGRPGQAPFMQQQQQPPYSQFPQGQQPPSIQQPQPTGFAPQPTGIAPQPTGFAGQPSPFGSSQLQPQATGFPAGQLQPQFTGFPGAAPQQPQQPQAQSFQQQYTGYPPLNQAQQPPPPVPQIPTRFKTSSDIANSFQDAAGSGAPPQVPPKTGSKIPSIRLSFITAQDQARFEQLFKSAVGDSKTMDGRFPYTQWAPCYGLDGSTDWSQ